MSRGKKRDHENRHALEIAQAKGWNVEILSWTHLRINGVIDVWPTTRKWMKSKRGPNDFAERYYNLNHLRRIVADHADADRPRKNAAEWFAALPADLESRPRPASPTWEDFAQRFGGGQEAPTIRLPEKRAQRPGSDQKKQGSTKQAALFDRGPVKKKDPLALHNARVSEKWGPEYVPDPNFERPPWN